ncbi:endonuclease-reverse transcriptase [Plakobranchus ocellatus]|uniref:Endonuclease-reverse transcriptase n=1 Tax=Plakobranchus ocellatus TaxID=259542 RepID=A0AAV4BL83_9GAST|nr:endonuclease-reverse transcriptase [Plakobranchus ocellatus]
MCILESPDGTTRNQKDFIMTSERNMSKDCGVITKIDVGSDHKMMRARIVVNSRLERLRRMKRKRPRKINSEMLEMHEEQFQLEIANSFSILEDNKPAIETFHKVMEEEAERFGKNREDKPNEQLEQDMVIERLRKAQNTHEKIEEKKQTLKRLNTQN